MTIKPCAVIQRYCYVCAGCNRIYHDEARAKECAEAGIPQTDFRPGDVVRGGATVYGWYDDWKPTPWVIREETKKGAFLHPCTHCYERVWVIVAVEIRDHRVRLHMVSLGGSSKEHRVCHCWTCPDTHFKPVRIDVPPTQIVDWWAKNKAEWTGKLAEHLS